MRIAFFGLGNMGNPIATNLIKQDDNDVSVCDLESRRGDNLVQQGGTWMNDVPTTLAHTDLVMTSLPGPKQLDAFAFGGNGMFQHVRQGATWIDLSTNNLETCRKIETAAKQKQVQFLDAPVSGGDEGARAGNLSIMVGGEQRVFDQHLPILQVIGEKIDLLGPNGAGYAAKISQVVLCYLHSVALSEALMLGAKAGVDTGMMLNIIQNSTGRSYVADRYGPSILNGDYDPSFALGLAHKDMRLAMDLANTLGITLPMSDLVEKTYQAACKKYGNEANHLMAIHLLEEANNMDLRAVPGGNNERSNTH